MQNSSINSEKLRSILFWTSTGFYVLFTRGSSLVTSVSKYLLAYARVSYASPKLLVNLGLRAEGVPTYNRGDLVFSEEVWTSHVI